MRGSVHVDQHLLDPEIEMTMPKLNGKTRKRQQLEKERKLQREATTSLTPQLIEPMENLDPSPPLPPPRIPCVNSPRRTTQFARNNDKAMNDEMKTRLLQIVYQNPFISLEHEDPYTYLTRFYEIAGSAGILEVSK